MRGAGREFWWTGGPDVTDPVANGRLVGSILRPAFLPFGRADTLGPEGQR